MSENVIDPDVLLMVNEIPLSHLDEYLAWPMKGNL